MTEVITNFSYVLIIHVFVFVLQTFTAAILKKNDDWRSREKARKKRVSTAAAATTKTSER